MADRIVPSGHAANFWIIGTQRPNDHATLVSWLLLILVVIVGAALRFWGLGNIGLHGDEEVMGLATRGILEVGAPVLPSGMYYPRALPQLSLMAMSTYLFGDTEWALRLPSVLIGTLAVFIAYWLGRRFMSTHWSILFALVIALLPSMISLSQTARMYGFYVTFLMLFAVTIFRWERTSSVVDYLIAILACLVAVSFHALTVFSMLLFLYPGIVKSSWRLSAMGAVGLVFCVAVNKRLGEWIGSNYFSLVKLQPDDDVALTAVLQNELSMFTAMVISLIVALVGVTVFILARRRQLSVERSIWSSLSAACLGGVLVLAVLVQFHMAGLAFAFGTLFAIRSGLGARIPIALGVLVSALLLFHAFTIWQSGEVDGFNDLVLTLIGVPSAWPYVVFSRFAPAAVVVYGFIAVYFAIRFARGHALPDHALFFLIAVFAPLFLIGFFAGYIPERYIVGFFPFFVLTAIAGVNELFDEYANLAHIRSVSSMAVVAVFLPILFVSPVALWYNVNPRYADFPSLSDHRGVDHKGAAEYVMSQGPGPDDLVIALDAQQQSYYLGNRLDYYMRSLNDSRNSSFVRDGRMVNLYTGTQQIATGEELRAVLSELKHGQVLIIGSGEIAKNPLRYMGDGIFETMQEFQVEEVYLGRDGATKVWRYVAAGGIAEPY